MCWIGFWLICFLIMGLVTPYSFWLIENDLAEFEKYSEPAEGTVIAIHTRAMSGQGGRVTSDPEVRFATPDGRTVTFIDRTSVDIDVAVGQRVPVRYMPGDPEYARIEIAQADNALLMRIVFVFIIVLGLIGSFFTGRAMLRAVRARRSSPPVA